MVCDFCTHRKFACGDGRNKGYDGRSEGYYCLDFDLDKDALSEHLIWGIKKVLDEQR